MMPRRYYRVRPPKRGPDRFWQTFDRLERGFLWIVAAYLVWIMLSTFAS